MTISLEVDQDWRFAVGEQELDLNERGNCSPESETARKPWSPPILTVNAVEDVTRGALDSTQIDGSNFFS